MSYDILLYPRLPGQEWAEVVAADEEEAHDDVLQDGSALADGVGTFGRIESRLRELVAGPVETWVAEETGGDVYGELSDTQTGLQVELFHGSAAVSFPYRDRDDLDAFHEQVRQAVRVVAEETGYEVYDPQTEQTFDGTFDDGPGMQATRALAAGEDPASAGPAEDRADDDGGDGDGPGAQEAAPPADRRQDPAFLRRRGMLYLVLGVLLTAYGLWRLAAAGGTLWITVVVLVIGVMDLLGGLMMLSLSRAAAAQREGAHGDGAQHDGGDQAG